MKHNEETGRSFGNIYLLGKLGDCQSQAFHGFKSYYAVALFFKEPIALQVLFLWGLVWIWKNRRLDAFLSGRGIITGGCRNSLHLVFLFQQSANWHQTYPPGLSR